jgi:hypothetical protein
MGTSSLVGRRENYGKFPVDVSYVAVHVLGGPHRRPDRPDHLSYDAIVQGRRPNFYRRGGATLLSGTAGNNRSDIVLEGADSRTFSTFVRAPADRRGGLGLSRLSELLELAAADASLPTGIQLSDYGPLTHCMDGNLRRAAIAGANSYDASGPMLHWQPANE